jgi:hypothetical protein
MPRTQACEAAKRVAFNSLFAIITDARSRFRANNLRSTSCSLISSGHPYASAFFSSVLSQPYHPPAVDDLGISLKQLWDSLNHFWCRALRQSPPDVYRRGKNAHRNVMLLALLAVRDVLARESTIASSRVFPIGKALSSDNIFQMFEWSLIQRGLALVYRRAEINDPSAS